MPTRKKTDPADKPWSDEARTADIEQVNELLRDVAGKRVTVETAFEYREDQSPKIALPSHPERMSYAEGAKLLSKKAEAEEEMYEFGEEFTCRPMDGAYAFNEVMKELYGMTAIGKVIRGWGGSKLPDLKTVHLSPTESVQVPWGLLEWPPWGAEFMLAERMDADYGYAFQVRGAAKKKYEAEIQGIFMLIHQYLKEHSIYRNTALVGVGVYTGAGWQEPEFLDPYTIDREEIVYNTDVYKALHHGLWGRIKAREQLASRGKRFNTKVLLHGENGTGKTVGALITAQFCLENDLTFIQARWDEDLGMVLKFAEHVGTPSVVAIEDAEKLIDEKPREMDKLLEQFDGMRTKGREVSLLLTTNHPEKLPPAIMRAGRINRTIYISDLNAEALRRLIDKRIPEAQREDLDYQELENAFQGFKPSWIVQVLDDAVIASIIRTGEVDQPLATDDFVQEALALRPQFETWRRSLDRPKKPEFTEAVADLIDERIDRAFDRRQIDMSDGEIMVTS